MKKQAGNTLAATLVTMVILLLLIVAFFKGSSMFGAKAQGTGRADGKGKTVPGLAKARARDEVCKNTLRQLRMSIGMTTDPVENTFPASLEDTKLGASMYKCVFGEAYEYDPATGEVHCKHLGHEKY